MFWSFETWKLKREESDAKEERQSLGVFEIDQKERQAVKAPGIEPETSSTPNHRYIVGVRDVRPLAPSYSKTLR